MGSVLDLKITDVIASYCEARRRWEDEYRENLKFHVSEQTAARLIEERRKIEQDFRQRYGRFSVPDSPLGEIWNRFIEETAKESERTCQLIADKVEKQRQELQKNKAKKDAKGGLYKPDPLPPEHKKFIREFLTDLNAEPIPGFTGKKREKYGRRIERSGLNLGKFTKEKLHRAVFWKYMRNLAHAQEARKQSYARFLKKCDEGYYPNADVWLKRGK